MMPKMVANTSFSGKGVPVDETDEAGQIVQSAVGVGRKWSVALMNILSQWLPEACRVIAILQR